MKKYCLIVLVILLLATMISCGGSEGKKCCQPIELEKNKVLLPSPELAGKIWKDMTYAEVTDILGLPQRILPNLCYAYDLSDRSYLEVAYRAEEENYYVNMVLHRNKKDLPYQYQAEQVRDDMTHVQVADILGLPQRMSPDLSYIYDLDDGSYLEMRWRYEEDVGDYCPDDILHCDKKNLPSREQAKQIRKGMKYDEVTEILGLPQRMIPISSAFAYAYDLSDGSYLKIRYWTEGERYKTCFYYVTETPEILQPETTEPIQ